MSNFQKNSKDYGVPDITYQLASVWANELEEGQEKARKGKENISNDQKRPDSDQIDCGTTQKIYPETTQKLPQKQDIEITPAQKGIVDFLLHHPHAGRKEIASHLGSLSEDGV